MNESIEIPISHLAVGGIAEPFMMSVQSRKAPCNLVEGSVNFFPCFVLLSPIVTRLNFVFKCHAT